MGAADDAKVELIQKALSNAKSHVDATVACREQQINDLKRALADQTALSGRHFQAVGDVNSAKLADLAK